MDSLKKLYPKDRFRSSKTKTPPELFIESYTEEDLNLHPFKYNQFAYGAKCYGSV